MENTNNKPKTNARAKVQEFGSVLSGMVMPNIGAFITWGLITAMFLSTGWIPNERLSQLISPMLTYLLPILIGYTGGYNIYGIRGGVIGAAATMGVVVGSDIPMFMGAMIMGPLSAVTLRKLDSLLEDHIKPGFEMIVNNFSSGILGIFLVLLGFFGIGPLVQAINIVLSTGVDFLINKGLIPLSSLFIEPAKVLFLNNAINHGILGPIGVTQAAKTGKSILFLLEPNPGPGLGVLLAYSVFGKGTAKSTAPGVAIIHCIGGIHEPYFPYILMKPVMIIAAMVGAVLGNFIFYFFNVGLVATASPGSFFSILAVAPRTDYLPILLGILVSTGASFLIGSIILKADKRSDLSLETATEIKYKMKNEPANNLEQLNLNKAISKVYVACDAGMGSSVMGASILKKKLKNEGFNIEVNHTSISKIPSDADLIVTHESLYDRVISEYPGLSILKLDNFLESPVYDEVVKLVKESYENKDKPKSTGITHQVISDNENSSRILDEENIILNANFRNKDEALQKVHNLLKDSGFVDDEYLDGMKKRELEAPTHFGIGLAIPHGTDDNKKSIKKSGIVVLTVPEGVDWDGENIKLIIGIAGKDNDHIDILANIAEKINTKEKVDDLVTKSDKEYIYNLLTNKY